MASKIQLWDREPCSRCGGSGHYSFNLMYGTTCFKCSGRGEQIVRKHRKMAADWTQASQAAKRPLAGDIQVGDRVAYATGFSVTKPAEPFRLVTLVERIVGTPQSNPGSVTISGQTTYADWIVLTFEDGETRRDSSNVVYVRHSSTDDILARCKLPATVKHVRQRL